MPINLRVAREDWAALRKHFGLSFRSRLGHETGAVGVLGESRGRNHEFLLARIFWPEPGDLQMSRGGLVFSATYLRRAHLVMRAEGLAGLVTFHTHPGATDHVSFSPFDDSQDPLLIDNLVELEPRTRLVSVVVGKESQAGRVWSSPSLAEDLAELIVVGDRLSYHPLDGRPEPPAPPPAAIFDRALALTAAGALHRLSRMVVAVVGASGTGSLVCELLARAGCRHIILIDDDLVLEINLNRILHATSEDAAKRTPKVEVLRRAIERLGLGCRVEAIHDNILADDVLMRLRDADLIFGCVDKAYPRKILSEFSYRYLRPYIDIGSEIGGDEHGIVSLDGRTNYVAPGRWCLFCTGLVTSRELAFESLSYAERERVIALGYSRDLVIKKPAVMELNMRAASFGMMLLRHLLQPFLLTPLPVTIAENLVTYTILPLDKPKAANAECRICQINPYLGHGDCAVPIGLDRGSLTTILGPR
jgi:ThiF family